MKANIIFDWLSKLDLKFDTEKLRFPKMIPEYCIDYSNIFLEWDDSNRASVLEKSITATLLHSFWIYYLWNGCRIYQQGSKADLTNTGKID